MASFFRAASNARPRHPLRYNALQGGQIMADFRSVDTADRETWLPPRWGRRMTHRAGKKKKPLAFQRAAGDLQHQEKAARSYDDPRRARAVRYL